MKNKEQFYKLILENIYNGVMVTDALGYVTYMNKPYGEFLELDPVAQIGKHCTEVVENTRMHIVGQTGKPEINMTQRIKGQDMVVQRIPIFDQGRVIAVFGQVMFKNIKDVTSLANRLSLLESKVKLYEQELLSLRATKYTFDSIIAQNPVLKSLKVEAMRASGNDYPILITGESGTGKEVFAQAIHQASHRKVHSFVRINCAAIPKDLLESELFGYAKGAFTGANHKGKPGKFELANNGTIFLDEIGDLPLEMQPKLLRVLEDKEFERIGDNQLKQSNFRLIAATNQNLEKMVLEGLFRQDLFYRINVIPLHIPPLRERVEDILPLTEHILKKLAKEASFKKITIQQKAAKVLQAFSWPGNVRELINILERVVAGLTRPVITIEDLPFFLKKNHTSNNVNNTSSWSKKKEDTDIPLTSGKALKNALLKTEKEVILQALSLAKNNKTLAAKYLGIHRTMLYKKIKKHSIQG